MAGGTILQEFTTHCGATIYLSDHSYHMPKVDILLGSP